MYEIIKFLLCMVLRLSVLGSFYLLASTYLCCRSFMIVIFFIPFVKLYWTINCIERHNGGNFRIYLHETRSISPILSHDEGESMGNLIKSL